MTILDQRPQARSAGLLERSVDDDVVVFDLETEDAHLVTPTTLDIWRRCNGMVRIQDFVDELTPLHGAEAAEHLVWQAIAELHRAALIDSDLVFPSVSGISRRNLLRKIGIGIVATPVITTISASAAAAAVTGATCSLGACSGSTNPANCQPTGSAATACGSAAGTTGCTCQVLGTPAACTCAL